MSLKSICERKGSILEYALDTKCEREGLFLEDVLNTKSAGRRKEGIAVCAAARELRRTEVL